MPEIVSVFPAPPMGVNAPCRCGSGKKYKKCHGSPHNRDKRSKARSQRVELAFDEPIRSKNFFLSIDPRTKRVAVLPGESISQPTSAMIEQNYAREKGRKVIARASVDAQEAHIDFDRALLAYDLCIAVDTNTRTVQGVPISVTGIVGGVPEINNEGKHWLRYKPFNCLEFRGVSCSPEKLGWNEVIRLYMQSPEYAADQAYCVIVDAHLNEIERINKRLDPILDTHLPSNFTIAYATADAGDNVHNQMLRDANRLSGRIFESLKADPSDHGLQNVQSPYYTAFRRWVPQA